MSRAAVLHRLRNSADLQGWVDSANILSNYSDDGRPSHLNPGPFIILRWEEPSSHPGVPSVTRTLSVWVHYPIEMSTDYCKVDLILDIVKAELIQMEHVEGTDGQTVTCISWEGSSRDMKDDAFSTISRNSIFKVLSRKTANAAAGR